MKAKWLFMGFIAFSLAMNILCCDNDDETYPPLYKEPTNDTIAKVDSIDNIDDNPATIVAIGTPFEKSVIDKFGPTDKSSNVNVFEKPQVVFNVPINTDTIIDEANGSKSIFRISIADFNLKKADESTVLCNISKSNDSLTCTLNMVEPYEENVSYKVYIKVKFEQKIDGKWVAIKDKDGNEYFEEQVSEFSAGPRPLLFNPEHIKYAYPADRQRNFLPKEYDEAYWILDFDYSYLFNEFKAKGYEQKIQITPSGGQPQLVDITKIKLNNGRSEINCKVEDLNLSNNAIYHLSLVNVPIDTSKTDPSVPEVIFEIDFGTSKYNSFTEKIQNFTFEKYGGIQVRGTVYSLIANFEENTISEESFDFYEYSYSNNSANCFLKLSPDYDNCLWYKEKIAPLIYENEAVMSIVGKYYPPMSQNVCAIGVLYNDEILKDDEINNGRKNKVKSNGAFNYNCMVYINKDFEKIKLYLANYDGELPPKAIKLLRTDNLPYLIDGVYPIKIEYKLPGKNIVTSENILNIEL